MSTAAEPAVHGAEPGHVGNGLLERTVHLRPLRQPQPDRPLDDIGRGKRFQGGNLSLGINSANNRVNANGYTYDSSGNVTNDGTNTYTWNAEGRMTSAAGVSYMYDGFKRRVEKSNSKLYWYGPHGEVLAESDLSGNILSEYIYFAGQRIARRDPNVSGGANVYYFLGDRLGSAKQIVSIGLNGTLNGCNSTTPTGCIVAESDYYPYGGERVITADATSNTYKFTGHERDSETGLDHTMFRQYSSNAGRWLAPDSHKGSPRNPQGWNRYSYTRGNPSTLMDPEGQCPTDPPEGYFCVDVTAPTDPELMGMAGSGTYGDPNTDPLGELNYGNPYAPDPTTGLPPPPPPGGYGMPQTPTPTPPPPPPPPPPSCLGVFLNTAVENLNPGLPSPAGPAGGFVGNSVAAILFNQALTYAEAAGLSYPLKSSTFRGLLETGLSGATLGGLITLDIGLGQALVTEIQTVQNGGCQP